MPKILKNYRAIGLIIAALKMGVILLLPVPFRSHVSDFVAWVTSASRVVELVTAGKFPAVSAFGAYLGIDFLLAPFYWLWTILPIEHPPLHSIMNYTAPAISLILLMKLPIFISDVLAGIFLTRLVLRLTKSERQSRIGFLTWFGNPYNIYWLYAFGAMDVIPAAIVLFALTFGLGTRWGRTAFVTTIAGFLRLFPFAALPFFFHLTNNRSSRLKLLAGFLIPTVSLITLLYATRGGAIGDILLVPVNESWLFEFLGGREHSWTTARGDILVLTPLLFLTQLYLVFRFWKPASNLVHLTSVAFLTILIGATTYGGSSQHFIWVSPLLSVCVALRSDENWIFALTFLTAYLSPAAFPFNLPMFADVRLIIDPLLAGGFYAMKATYLIRLNLSNIELSPQTIETTRINR